MARGRPKKVLEFPNGLRQGQPVKFRCSEYKEPKLGLIYDRCKYDGGIIVWVTAESSPGHRVTACIQIERGDTIEGIEIETQPIQGRSRTTEAAQ